jgi:putative hydrolase of the HAD superfamily
MVLFLDVDDTLFDSESAYKFAMKEIGVDDQGALFLKARALTKANLPENAPVARSRFLYFKKYLELQEKYNPKEHFELATKYESLVVDHLSDQWNKLKRPHLFKQFHSKYKSIALVTNETLRMQTLKVMAIDPRRDFFDFLITSEEVGFEKPHTNIFNAALEATKSTPSQTLMVGDSYQKDILGARALGIKGIKTIEFKNDNLTDEETSVIKSLEELLDLN